MQITSDARIEILKDAEERPLLVLESRQKTAIALGVVLAVGIVACTAYLVGRRLPGKPEAGTTQTAAHHTNPPLAVATPPAAAAPIVIQTPAPALTPAAAPSTPVQPKPVQPTAAPAPVFVPPVANPTQASPASGLYQPEKGQNFLQVAALAPDTVQPFLAELTAKGFKGRIAPGADSRFVRILVGPFKNADLSAVSADLTEAGFPNFPKFY